jgi:hypothetical protein
MEMAIHDTFGQLVVDVLLIECTTLEARIAELETALHALVNNLPDLVLDLAGPEVGWSNVSAIRSARDMARAALEHKEA